MSGTATNADISRRLAGVSSVAINGSTFQLVSAPKWSVSTFERKTMKGQDSLHGYSEEYAEQFIELTLRDSARIGVAGFNAMTNVEVVISLASGKTVTGNPMWAVNTQEVDSAEATVTVRFEGPNVNEG